MVSVDSSYAQLAFPEFVDKDWALPRSRKAAPYPLLWLRYSRRGFGSPCRVNEC